ncbi:MAG: glycoside hydrolase family 1 protein [Candidatus Dojkabacteria bacterium]|jgi:beta-glucosidase
MAKQNYIFPKGFYWGASTASHQVEGNNKNDWSVWEESPKRIAYLKESGLAKKVGLQNFISGKSADHYNKFREDFKLAKDLGHNATRFSIEWSRIEPEEGKFDEKEINHYKSVIKYLKQLNIEPFVTLWHWPLPLWLSEKGGWENSKTPKYFERYARRVVEALGDDVKYWITLNEPEIYSGMSYLFGVWPPQKKSRYKHIKVVLNLRKGHILAYKCIKKINSKAQIGITKNNAYFNIENHSLINRIVKNYREYTENTIWLDAIKNYQDFIGLNHYFHNKVNYFTNDNDNLITNDLGWEIYPTSLYHALIDLKKYNKPIYITENGLADAKDKKRFWYIYTMVKEVHQAIQDGVDVKGYLHWSLMDNFEWADGYWPRFGLIEIDYNTLKRKPRESAFFYKDICINNGITKNIQEKYKEKIKTPIS